MDRFDPAGEYLRIAEHYRQMSDEELLVLVPQSSELTPMAQQALASEIRQRGLKTEAADNKLSAPSQFKASRFRAPTASFEHESTKMKFRDSGDDDVSDSDSSDDPDAYEEDRKLVDLCTVWSVRDALQVQTILDERGIPFFMGPEKAMGVDEVTSDFSKGVGVQIMQIGMFWARAGMGHYEPEDDPTPKEKEELEELPVRCPKCYSTEVVFEGLTSAPAMATDESSQKYKWTCDSCGNQWEDDGVAEGG
jgi:hypothetical protein